MAALCSVVNSGQKASKAARSAPDRSDKSVSIDRHYVSERLEEVVKSEDLSHYIL